MTLDELVKVANEAIRKSGRSAEFADVVMVRAVVRALRDSLYPAEDADAICSVGEIRFELNEILGEQS